MKAVACSAIWWLQIDKEIEDEERSCPNCACHRNSPPPPPLHNWLNQCSDFTLILPVPVTSKSWQW